MIKLQTHSVYSILGTEEERKKLLLLWTVVGGRTIIPSLTRVLLCLVRLGVPQESWWRAVGPGGGVKRGTKATIPWETDRRKNTFGREKTASNCMNGHSNTETELSSAVGWFSENTALKPCAKPLRSENKNGRNGHSEYAISPLPSIALDDSTFFVFYFSPLSLFIYFSRIPSGL